MRPRTVALLALVVLIVTPAVAAPPPRPVCEPCGSGFVDASTWYGEMHGTENQTGTGVEHSTATVRVYGNETAVWTVKNRLTSERAVRFFRENETAFAEIAQDAEGYGEKTLLSARIVGNDTVVLRYRSDEQATRTRGGVLRFDGFREVGGERFSGLGADELTVRGPPGTVVTRAPTGAAVAGNEFTLTEYRDGGDGPFVTFAQSGGVVGETWSFVSVAEALGDDVVRNVLFDVLLPAGALFALLVGFVRVGGRIVKRNEATVQLAAKVVGGLGVLGLLFGFAQAVQGDGRYSLGVLFAGGAYAALALFATSDARPTLKRAFVAAVLAWVVGLVVTTVTVALTDPSLVSRLLELNYYAVTDLLFAAFGTLLLLSMSVVGYAATDPRYRRAAVVLPPAVLAVAVAAMRPLTRVGTSLDIFFSVLFAAFVLGFLALFGLPAFVLGRAMPTRE
ncbi:hypothetical protein [Haladaptatus salinisoli]|uniref:hypothetical protein n=1 Tax=Haladaptatus salinisoli TaxID=2884876 RepID=UPI001D0BB7C0|nr:hypothetical protein [Haladaptatus salinisoli]